MDRIQAATSEELAAWCREKLARYKNPREYSIVGALPRNPSGKVLKTALRDEHHDRHYVADPKQHLPRCKASGACVSEEDGKLIKHDRDHTWKPVSVP